MSQELLGPHYFDCPYHLLCLPVSAPYSFSFILTVNSFWFIQGNNTDRTLKKKILFLSGPLIYIQTPSA